MLSKLIPWLRGQRTCAVHWQDGDKHAVMIGALRVLVTEEAQDVWSAVGIDIYYAASGNSVSDVQQRFESGLRATLRNHLERFGTIEKLLRFAPRDVWEPLVEASKHFDLNLIAVHEIDQTIPVPFGTIAYYNGTMQAS